MKSKNENIIPKYIITKVSRKNTKIYFKYKVKLNYNYILFTFIILLLLKAKIMKLYPISEIKLTIKGREHQNVLHSTFNVIPNEILINGNEINKDEIAWPYQYDMPNDENEIIIRYYGAIQHAYYMFNNLINVIKVDLSNFDATEVTNSEGMFYNCSSLKTINFRNVNFNKNQNIAKMFYKCPSLESVDMSNINLSSVATMIAMFYECTKLTSINLSNNMMNSLKDIDFLFAYCDELETINLDNFKTPALETAFYSFGNCLKLTSLNLNSFDTSKVKNMRNMFYSCQNLRTLEINNFDTSNVENMRAMFSKCSNLVSLNLNHFNTSKVNNMINMFSQCEKLESLTISNFVTSSVESMYGMFNGCLKLSSLDLSSFETSKVTNMDNMFNKCGKLKSLNLANFETPLLDTMANMFSSCTSLEYLKLNNFKTTQITDSSKISDFFNGVSENIIFCLDLNNNPLFEEALENYKNNVCPENCYTNQNKKIILDLKQCITNCKEHSTHKMEYNGYCYQTCPTGTHSSTNNNNFLCYEDCQRYYNYDRTECVNEILDGYYLSDDYLKTVLKCSDKCKKCNKESMNINLCINCNNERNYYEKINDQTNNPSYINCYNQKPESYYFDNSDKMYKPCHSTCKECSEFGENRCTECYPNFNLIGNICYDASTTIMTTIMTTSITTSITTIMTTTMTTTITDNAKNENNTNGNYSNIENAKFIGDELFEILDIIDKTYIFRYKLNIDIELLKENYSNFTLIEFPQETKDYIINYYNLEKEKNQIYILIKDYQNITSNLATSYYKYKLILKNGTELNLTEIKNKINSTQILHSKNYVPLRNPDLVNLEYYNLFIKDGYDIFDKDSEFYKDQCISANIDGNDIVIKDRKKYIYPNNITICSSCDYMEFDIDNMVFVCSCDLGNDENNNEENVFEEEDDGNFITYFLDYVNYKIFKCYKLYIFDNLKANAYFYFLLFFLLLIIVDYIIFNTRVIRNIKFLLFKEFPSEIKIKNEYKKNLKIQKKNTNKISHPLKKKNKNNKNIKIIKKKINNRNIKVIKNNKNKMLTSNITVYNKTKNNMTINNTLNIKSNKKLKAEEEEETKDDGYYNELPYSLAVKFDNRNIFVLFKSILFKKIDFINLFTGEEKIKMILLREFILSLLLNFYFNTFLYNDDVVSNKLHNNGQLDFFVTLVLSLMSNIITSFISYLINFSEIIEKRMELVLDIKNPFLFSIVTVRFIRYAKIRSFFFFIGEILISLLCLYYIVIFYIIYVGSRKSLIINYLLSLVEGLIISVGITIIVTSIRKISLCIKNKYLYNTSKYLNDRF